MIPAEDRLVPFTTRLHPSHPAKLEELAKQAGLRSVHAWIRQQIDQAWAKLQKRPPK